MQVSCMTRAGGEEFSWSLIAFSLASRLNKIGGGGGGVHIWKLFLGVQYILGERGPLTCAFICAKSVVDKNPKAAFIRKQF